MYDFVVFNQNIITRNIYFSEVRVTRSLVLCVMFCGSLFVLFLLPIVLSVLRFTDSDYLLSIFKLSFKYIYVYINIYIPFWHRIWTVFINIQEHRESCCLSTYLAIHLTKDLYSRQILGPMFNIFHWDSHIGLFLIKI